VRIPTARLGILPLLLPLLLIAVPAPVIGQDYVGNVWSQLQQAKSRYPNFNVRTYVIDRLSAGSNFTYSSQMNQGGRYLVTGACDQDCTDVDISVANEAGTLIARDEKSDALPEVLVVPSANGKYTVTVTVVECSNEPCYFGLGIFSE
jgi:hypothetical protein